MINMAEYYPELAKQKHTDIQALNMARFKMEYHRFCMITWENCVKYAIEMVALGEEEEEEEINKKVFEIAEDVFEFIDKKADEMFERRYKNLEREARGTKPLDEKEFSENFTLSTR